MFNINRLFLFFHRAYFCSKSFVLSLRMESDDVWNIYRRSANVIIINIIKNTHHSCNTESY